MKAIRFSLPIIVVCFLTSTGAHAADDAQTRTDSSGKCAVYQGTDPRGRLVQLTISDIDVPEFVRISPDAGHTRYPQLHWSSQIGAGKAASLEHSSDAR
jgi:hypothetical protein